MHKILEDLHWRYATKRFDASKKIGEADLDVIRKALRLTPTSYGLQAMKFLFIESPEIRTDLMQASHGQRAVLEASHLVVLCAERSIRPELIDNYIRQSGVSRNLDAATMAPYSDFLKRTLTTRPEEEITAWTSRQVYIAMGILLSVCAQLRIDALPMEGFQAELFNEILGLEKQNLSAVLVCPIGYRHAEDLHQHHPKVRRPEDELFEIR